MQTENHCSLVGPTAQRLVSAHDKSKLHGSITWSSGIGNPFSIPLVCWGFKFKVCPVGTMNLKRVPSGEFESFGGGDDQLMGKFAWNSKFKNCSHGTVRAYRRISRNHSLFCVDLAGAVSYSSSSTSVLGNWKLYKSSYNCIQFLFWLNLYQFKLL